MLAKNGGRRVIPVTSSACIVLLFLSSFDTEVFHQPCPAFLSLLDFANVFVYDLSTPL
jgi:hypothetical protein